MSSNPSEFRADTFATAFRERLAAGKSAFDWLLDAYVWAQSNWQQIAQFSPDFDRDTMRSLFRQTFHLDPASIVAAAVKLGGGKSPGRFDAGKKVLQLLGVREAINVANRLPEEDAKTIADQMLAPGANRDAVLADAKARMAASRKPRSDFRLLYQEALEKLDAALKEIVEHKQTIAMQRREIEILRELMPRRQSA